MPPENNVADLQHDESRDNPAVRLENNVGPFPVSIPPMVVQNRGMFTARLGRKHFIWAFIPVICVFWFSALLNIIIVIDSVSSNVGPGRVSDAVGSLIGNENFGWAVLLVMFVSVIILITLCGRRLLDMGQSSSWSLLALVPFVNIVLLIFLLVIGSKEPNPYGESTSRVPFLKALFRPNVHTSAT